MSKVYLIAQPTVPKSGKLPDLTPLSDYGDIVVVIEAGDYPSFKPGDAWNRILRRMCNFDAENDYIVWAGGDTLSSVLVGQALSRMGHRAFRWLRFERARKPNGDRDPSRGNYTVIDVQCL